MADITGSTVTSASTISISAAATSTIKATVVGVAGAGAFGGNALAAAIGSSIASNQIGGPAPATGLQPGSVLAYIADSKVTATGLLNLSANGSQTITAGVGAGSVAITAGGGVGVSLAGAGASATNQVDVAISAEIYNDASGTASETISARSIGIAATDSSQISSTVASAALAAAIAGGGGAAAAVSVGLAQNTISDAVTAQIGGVSSVTTTGTASTDGVSISATSNGSITASSTAASVAIAGGGAGFAVAGGGAEANNTITSTTVADITGSTVSSASTISISASATSTIKATVVGVAGAGGFGGSAVAAAIGSSVASNQIGGPAPATGLQPGSVLAYIADSKVTATGLLNLSANGSQSITAGVGAGSVAITAGAGVGVSLAGAGASATNQVDVAISAEIYNDASGTASETISAGSIGIVATDGSIINSTVASAALAAAIAGGAGVAAAVCVGLAENTIDDAVTAEINGESSVTTTGTASTAGVNISAVSSASISASSTAASLAIGAGSNGFAVSGGGAEAHNVIGSTTVACIMGSSVTSAAGVSIVAAATDGISATVVGVSGAGGFGANAVAAAIGSSVARNEIGGAAPATGLQPGSVLAYVSNSKITATGLLNITANGGETIGAGVGAGSAAITGGALGSVALAGAGAEAQNIIQVPVEAYIDSGGFTADSIKTGSLAINATDAPGITATVAAASLSAAIGLVGVGISIGVALAENVVTDTVEAFINHSPSVDIAGGVSIGASENASISDSTVASSLAIAGGVAGLALSGAGANATNEIDNQVSACIANSTVAANLYFNYLAGSDNADTTLVAGQRVMINGQIYQYTGKGTLGGGTGANATILGLSNPNNVGGLASINYAADPSDWTLVPASDMNITASNTSTITSLVGGVAGAGSAGLGAAAGAIGAATAYNLFGVTDPNIDISIDANSTSGGSSSNNPNALPGASTSGDGTLQNQALAYVYNSSVGVTGNLAVQATSSETLTVDAFAGSVAIAIGIGGGAAGAGVGTTNIFATQTQAYLLDSTAMVMGNATVHALDHSEIVRASAVAGAIATGLSSLSVAATTVNDTMANDVETHVTGTSADVIMVGGTLTIDSNGDLTGGSNVGVAEVDKIVAVTASVSGGFTGASGGGIGVYNTIENKVDSTISGAIMVSTQGDVNVAAQDNATEAADLTAVTVAISLGAAIGAAIVNDTIGSTITAEIDAATVDAADVSVKASSTANLTDTKAVGVATSLVGAQGNNATASIDSTTTASIFGGAQISAATGSILVSSNSNNQATANADGGAFGAIAVGAMIANVNLGNGYGVGDVIATVDGTNTSLIGRNVQIIANDSDALYANSVATGGGLVAVGGAQTNMTTTQATVANLTGGAHITAVALNVVSSHTQDVDATADAYTVAAATGSGAGVSNNYRSAATININNATVVSNGITVSSSNSLSKQSVNKAGGDNLKTGSGSLVGLAVMISSTNVGTSADPFASTINISGSSLTAIGSFTSPATLIINAANAVAAADQIEVDSVSLLQVNTGNDDIHTQQSSAVNIASSTVNNETGDLYVTTSQSSYTVASTNIMIASGLQGLATAEATSDENEKNTVTVNNSTLRGNTVYVRAGEEQHRHPRHRVRIRLFGNHVDFPVPQHRRAAGDFRRFRDQPGQPRGQYRDRGLGQRLPDRAEGPERRDHLRVGSVAVRDSLWPGRSRRFVQIELQHRRHRLWRQRGRGLQQRVQPAGAAG